MNVSHQAALRPDRGFGAHAATLWWLGLGAFVAIALAVSLRGEGNLPLRTLLGIPLVLLIPGHALTALFWGRRPLGVPERLALAIGVSVALAALSGLVLNWTPAGIRGGQQTLLLGLVALAAIVALLIRDLGWPGTASGSAATIGSLPFASLGWRQLLLLGAAVVMVTSAVAYATSSAVRPHGPGFTQSWLHSQDSQAGTLELGVENDERQAETYHLQLSLNGRRVRDWNQVRLQPGQRWSTTQGLPQARGRGLAELVVFRSEDPTKVYRRVRVDLGASSR